MLSLEHVAWDLPEGGTIIKDINLTLEDQKLIVVTGPNGGGKTSAGKIDCLAWSLLPPERLSLTEKTSQA